MKTTIPTSDPIFREALAFYILYTRLGFEPRKIEVFLFPNTPRPSQKIPVQMQLRFPGQVGICLTHMGMAFAVPLGKLVDLKYEVFEARYKEATGAIENNLIDPIEVQGLFEKTYTFGQVEHITLNLFRNGFISDHQKSIDKVIKKFEKKGDIVVIDVSDKQLDTGVKQ